MVHIEIRKHTQTDDEAIYDFCVGTPSPGRLRIDRRTGQVIHLELCGCPGDPEYHGRRAGRKVWQHWKEGALPDVTHYERD